MSSLAHSLVSWQDFLRLPERPETGRRHELHDGEVVIVPPARPLHIKMQKAIEQLLELAGDRGVVTTEFPYRPVVNLQFWFADVAYIPWMDWDAMPPNEYPVYAPPLIVEVLSPSNTPSKVNRQRIVAMSSGTEEFWVIDADARTIHVTRPDGIASYSAGGLISIPMSGDAAVAVDRIFA